MVVVPVVVVPVVAVSVVKVLFGYNVWGALVCFPTHFPTPLSIFSLSAAFYLLCQLVELSYTITPDHLRVRHLRNQQLQTGGCFFDHRAEIQKGLGGKE